MTDIAHLQGSHTASGIVGIVGIALALWSASNYVAAFMRASNVIYDVPEGRPIWKTAPIRLGVTLVTMILLVAASVIVVVTGGLAQRVGNVLGVGSAAVTAWDIAKWPVLLIIIGLILAILFWASPNARHGFQWVSPGGLIAVVLWLIASAAFAVYIANFSHYNKIYGSLAGLIIFLIWMWISNVAILLGAEFNAELERGRAVAGGHPPGREPFSELRDDRKLRKRKKERAAAELRGSPPGRHGHGERGTVAALPAGQDRPARSSLSAHGDVELIGMVQSLPRGSSLREAACEELVRRYDFLVRHAAMRYRHSPEPLEELLQAG